MTSRNRRFTLVELLVVIAIITILLGMLFPTLHTARISGQRTDCLNNKSQVMKAQLLYAEQNHNQYIFTMEKDNTPYSLSLYGYDGDQKSAIKEEDRQLAASEAPHLPVFISEDALSCPLSGKKGLKYVTGMFDNSDSATGDSTWDSKKMKKVDGSDSQITHMEFFGKFTTTDVDKKVICYMPSRLKNAVDLVLFSDSFDKDGNSYWKFKISEADSNGCVTLLHMDTAPSAFADGHARSLDLNELMNSPSTFDKSALHLADFKTNPK